MPYRSAPTRPFRVLCPNAALDVAAAYRFAPLRQLFTGIPKKKPKLF